MPSELDEEQCELCQVSFTYTTKKSYTICIVRKKGLILNFIHVGQR